MVFDVIEEIMAEIIAHWPAALALFMLIVFGLWAAFPGGPDVDLWDPLNEGHPPAWPREGVHDTGWQKKIRSSDYKGGHPMCNFFSFKTDGNSKIYYFSAEQRKAKVTYPDGQTIDSYDSHTAIETFYGLKDTDWLSGEYNPFTDRLVIDQQHTTWDDAKVRGMLAGVDWRGLCGDLVGARAFLMDLKNIPWLKPDGRLEDTESIRIFKTRDAARDAAWDAARDAAWAAARAAAWDAALYVRCIHVCDGLPLDQKHIDHAKLRMDVWRHGYGVYADVNGVLYCYERI